LAALEILANYAIIPANLSLTKISIPDEVAIEEIADEALPEHWDSIIPGPQSQHFRDQWIEQRRTAVLSVPSSIITSERNFVINPAHPAFRKIHFSVPQAFVFDPRLRSAAATS
jgi:RES domain-containing protein